MTILSILVALLLGGMLLWLAVSQWYMHRRRACECTLITYLAGLYARFGIDAAPNGFARDYLRTADGVCLALYVLQGAPDAPVYVFMPGTAAYAQLYAQLLVDLHRRGCTVVAYDPRGHGRSGRWRGYFTVTQAIDDARAVCAWAHSRFGRKVVFSGSSQGGVIGLYVAATDDPAVATVVCHNIAWLDGNTIRQIAILKPPLWLVPFLCWLFLRLRAWSIPVTWYLPFDKLKLPGGGSAMELMRTDPLVTLAYGLGAISTLAKTDLARPLDRITTPLMLISSRGDEVFPVAYEQHLFDQLTCQKRFLLLGDLPHLMILKPPPELIDAVVDWIRVHAPGRWPANPQAAGDSSTSHPSGSN
jgi:alpha-beta hydrolase superfamily lysophospholipase